MHNLWPFFSSIQWQEKPAQMQSIAPQKQVGELCDQICGTIYQLHSVLNLLWLTWWPDCLRHSTGLNPAELNRNKQKSAAHLIGRIWSKRHSKKAAYIFLLQNIILSGYFVQVVQNRAHHLEFWSGRQNSARPSQRASNTSTVAFRSMTPACTSFTPVWSFFQSRATPKTFMFTKCVCRETTTTVQSWKITERDCVRQGANSRGWPGVT